jgi:hypothetical protein
MTERRSAPRVTPAQPLAAKLKSALPARVLDVSAGGIQLEVGTSLRPQADCELRVELPDGEITLRARVRRCRAWGFGLDDKDRRVLLYRAGLQFLEDEEGPLELLRSTLLPPGLDDEGHPDDKAGHGEEVTVPTSAPDPKVRRAPRREGPVRIRINSEHIRRILSGGGGRKG